jgi:hypothetical protein
VRDTFYLGLVHRMPVLMTWDEALTEDEHRMIAEVKMYFDWSQPLEDAPAAVLVSDADAGEAGRRCLAAYENAFTHGVPLDYRFISRREDARPGEWVIVPGADGVDRQPIGFSSPASLPQALHSAPPIAVSNEYAASYCLTRRHDAMLAYIYNTADHGDQRFYLGARYHRRPRRANLRITLLNLAAGRKWRLYDLNDKKLAIEGLITDAPIQIVDTAHDYLLCVWADGR